ncbi:hypothetical protein P9A47_gp84 [Xanthomonas phage Elanor]|uniref:Uncharacterized protein n=1 Tax=Xanthomonas phage Elanor TaxID=2939127 RepID=A0A9E7E1M2_9CAUD|nr:hypothetical protein P9A47_gp84 [Xanthomonas phage Elanor]URA07052.1 hypothetical protein Elanor_BL40084 [Xanthomonas phage Elanor]
MDINEYMQESLSQQKRQTALLEAILEGIKDINENGVFIANATDDPVVVSIFGATPVVEAAGTTSQASAQAQATKQQKETTQQVAPKEQKQAAPVVEEKQAASVEEKQAAPKEEKKKVTIDDARTALKAYAAIEGNDAAMDLLASLKAASVSALAEQGPEALQKLIDKTQGKAVEE